MLLKPQRPPCFDPSQRGGPVRGPLSEGLEFESQCVHFGHPSAGGCQRSTGDPRLILGKGYRLVVLGGYGRTDPLLNKPFYPNGLVVGILTGASEVLSVGATATTRLVPAFVAGSGATSPTAQLSFTLDFGASSCYYTPSFSRNLVGVSHLHDLGVVTTFPLHEPVAPCTVSATGAPLATFHREPGSGLYSLHTRSHHIGSGESRGGVAAPAPAAAAAVSVGASGESRGAVTAAAVAAATLSVGASGESRGGVTSAAGAGTVAEDARGGRAATTATARPARPSTCTLGLWSSTVPSCSPCPVPLRRSRYRADGPFQLVLRSRVPSPPVLPHPPKSSLIVLLDPLSDYLRASRPIVSFVLSALVTHPTVPLSSISALVTTVAGFASSHRLDYAAHLVSGPARSPSFEGAPVFLLEVLEDRQFELGFLAAVIAAEEAEMASYRSTGTYVDAVPPPGANIVRGMWLYKVKRPPGAPPVFKVRYVARGFSQQEGVDFFQTFAPTPKMTTLRVLLQIAAQSDYDLHSLDFTVFLQGSLHKQIWLHHPPGFTGTFPPGT
ncbi:unnamed protein product [Closterium sp. NIES-53]